MDLAFKGLRGQGQARAAGVRCAQWLIYNDCVFRTRNLYDFIMFHDRDEFVHFVGLEPHEVDLSRFFAQHFGRADVASVTYWGGLYHLHCHMLSVRVAPAPSCSRQCSPAPRVLVWRQNMPALHSGSSVTNATVSRLRSLLPVPLCPHAVRWARAGTRPAAAAPTVHLPPTCGHIPGIAPAPKPPDRTVVGPPSLDHEGCWLCAQVGALGAGGAPGEYEHPTAAHRHHYQTYAGYDIWAPDERRPNFTGCTPMTCHPKSVVRPLGVDSMSVHHVNRPAKVPRHHAARAGSSPCPVRPCSEHPAADHVAT